MCPKARLCVAAGIGFVYVKLSFPMDQVSWDVCYGGTRVAVTQVSIELTVLFACHFGLSHSTFSEQGEMLCDSQLQVHLSLKGLAAGHS